jgi:malate synthase
VRDDKLREAGDGFDGTWVAHPDLVPVAMEVFDDVLGERPNQVDRLREDVQVSAAQLLDVAATEGDVTDEGLRNDVSVAIQYLSSWLGGNGAVAIFDLMEDAATAEIARSQIWQWIRHRATTPDGTPIDRERVRRVMDEELERIRETVGDEAYRRAPVKEVCALVEQVALAEELPEFLTLPAYELLD